MAKANQKLTGRQRQAVSKSTWDKFSAPVAVISLVVSLLLGFFTYHLTQERDMLGQQKDVWEGRLNQAKEQLEDRQKQLDLAKQELEKVKQDLNEYVKKEVKTSVESSKGEISDKTFQFSLMRSQPTDLMPHFNMEITGLIFKPNPDRYAVNAKVVYKDHPALTIGNAEVGYKVTYPEKDGYDIEVLKATPVSATFAIMKSRNPPPK